MKPMTDRNTIAAVSTPAGTGGIAVLRLSGPRALEIAQSVWRGRSLMDAPANTVRVGEIVTSGGDTLDQAVATVFRTPHSFTGEDTVEFSIHGSPWLQREVLARLLEAGAEAAGPGEFSRRAVMNGRMDLAQAEGVADMIAVSSRAAHRLAATQMKGGFSRRLDALRGRLVELASLLELELDFSEEDVEFADRRRLTDLCSSAGTEVKRLADSFRRGRVLKEGVAAVIAGVPNAGKSTLLNRLLDDDKAIVSDIPGTTRDVIEDTAEIDGILYRFIDTAGLRDSTDTIERIGIERANARIASADILLWIFDPTSPMPLQLSAYRETLSLLPPDTPVIRVLNKADLTSGGSVSQADIISGVSVTQADISSGMSVTQADEAIIPISAETGEGVELLLKALRDAVTEGRDLSADLIVTNARHYDALRHTASALDRVGSALAASLAADLIAQDLREAIHHLGLITGAITTDTILHTIFERFCIGK